MAQGIRSDEEQAELEALVADLDRLVTDACGSQRNGGRLVGPMAEAAKVDVLHAANAVSVAAFGSERTLMDRARKAIATATDSCAVARIGNGPRR